ncbi:MAG: HIRAN domain-containing protein [Ruminococcus sp.]|nr:HIRAN domain-containing protein [Ruminococcus sp.]
MENTYFITITGINYYYGQKPFEIGRVIKLIKETNNVHDKEAICAFLPFIDKIGYVANSTSTVYAGTISAGRLYDKIEDYAYAKVMFVTHSSAIALVLDKEDVEEVEEEQISDTVDKTTDGELEKNKGKKKTTSGKVSIGFHI